MLNGQLGRAGDRTSNLPLTSQPALQRERERERERDATQLGGAGDRTSNLAATSEPALPPEPHAATLASSERTSSKSN